MIALLLTVFGGLGAVVRFVSDGLIRSALGRNFPWATMIINVIGSGLLGFLTGLVLLHSADRSVLLIFGTGFCGGFTTFSTASFEAVRLIQERRVRAAILQVGGNLVLSLAAAVFGMWLATI